MYQLTYSSISKEGLIVEDLENILETAKSINFQNDISGCLVYHNENFIQILEGEEENVLKIYDKIKEDGRHHSIKLLWDNQINTRSFQEWNMAFYLPSDQNGKLFVENILLLSDYSEKSTSSSLSFWAEIGKVLRGKTLNR